MKEPTSDASDGCVEQTHEVPRDPSPTTTSRTMTFRMLSDDLLALPGPCRIVAVDGPGGAGKTTFAHLLASATDAPTALLHTDSFATPDEPTSWWPRLHRVIDALASGRPTSFEPFDWPSRSLLSTVVVEPAALVIVEGVSSSRQAWNRHLSYRIWMAAGPNLCRERGMARDGVLAADWDDEAASEAAFFEADGARSRADLVIDSASVNDEQFGFTDRR